MFCSIKTLITSSLLTFFYIRTCLFVTHNDHQLHITIINVAPQVLHEYWMTLRDRVSAIDELGMATERLRMRLPDEPKPKVLHIIEPHEVGRIEALVHHTWIIYCYPVWNALYLFYLSSGGAEQGETAEWPGCGKITATEKAWTVSLSYQFGKGNKWRCFICSSYLKRIEFLFCLTFWISVLFDLTVWQMDCLMILSIKYRYWLTTCLQSAFYFWWF